MEPWQKAFVEYIAPKLTTRGLRALHTALTMRRDLLIKEYSTSPIPLLTNADRRIVGADPIALAIWKGNRLSTVGEVEQLWCELCNNCTVESGDDYCVWYFVEWWDCGQYDVTCPFLANTVNAILQARFDAAAAEMVAQN